MLAAFSGSNTIIYYASCVFEELGLDGANPMMGKRSLRFKDCGVEGLVLCLHPSSLATSPERNPSLRRPLQPLIAEHSASDWPWFRVFRRVLTQPRLHHRRGESAHVGRGHPQHRRRTHRTGADRPLGSQTAAVRVVRLHDGIPRGALLSQPNSQEGDGSAQCRQWRERAPTHIPPAVSDCSILSLPSTNRCCLPPPLKAASRRRSLACVNSTTWTPPPRRRRKASPERTGRRSCLRRPSPPPPPWRIAPKRAPPTSPPSAGSERERESGLQ